jgi:hypothetical protein
MTSTLHNIRLIKGTDNNPKRVRVNPDPKNSNQRGKATMPKPKKDPSKIAAKLAAKEPRANYSDYYKMLDRKATQEALERDQRVKAYKLAIGLVKKLIVKPVNGTYDLSGLGVLTNTLVVKNGVYLIGHRNQDGKIVQSQIYNNTELSKFIGTF